MKIIICGAVIGFTSVAGYSLYIYLRRRKAHQTETTLCSENNIVIKVCTDAKEVVEGLRLLGNCSLIGLDCEWRPRFLKAGGAAASKVAVLQLASSHACLIIQLLRVTESHREHPNSAIPQELIDILSCPNVLKVGVGILDDCRKLLADYGLHCAGLVDLRHLSRRERIPLRAESLQAMSAFAGLPLTKDPSVRLSDWSARTLDAAQVHLLARSQTAPESLIFFLENPCLYCICSDSREVG